jgi:hypothetical protein
MNISKILLIGIILIIIILLLSSLILPNGISLLNQPYLMKESINNDLPDNNIVAQGDTNLLIPTSNQVYNPHDSNRTGNTYSRQQTVLMNNNQNTTYVNTDISIPLVYSMDELKDTTVRLHYPPSYVHHIIDAGSGDIEPERDDDNNNVLTNFRGIN